MTISHPTISNDLRRLFDAELANEAAMRGEARRKGADDMDPNDDEFVPAAHLDSAYDSWQQMHEDIAIEVLDLTTLPADEREQRLQQVEADLLALIERHGSGLSLISLI